MKVRHILGGLAVPALVVGTAVLCFGQTVAPGSVTDRGIDPAQFVVTWVCGNQDWVVYLLGILIAHSGFSVVSAVVKKLGFSDGVIVQIIRTLAVDVKPPASVIVQQAHAIEAAQAQPQAKG